MIAQNNIKKILIIYTKIFVKQVFYVKIFFLIFNESKIYKCGYF